MANSETFNFIRLIPRDSDFLSRRVGNRGEIFYDSGQSIIKFFDGSNAGGIDIARKDQTASIDLANVSDATFAHKAALSGIGSAGVTISDTAPNDPAEGDFWFNTTSTVLSNYNGTSWVPIAASVSQGTLASTALQPNTSITLTDVTLTSGTSVNEFSVDGTLTGNSDDAVPTEKAVKSYVDNAVILEINDLTDVDTTGVATGNTLAWNGVTGQWEPQASGGSFNGGDISGALTVSNTTNSTSTTTGAVKTTGGIGVAKDIFVGGKITIQDQRLDIKAGGEIRVYSTTNSRYSGFKASDSATADIVYTLPVADGSTNYFLRTDGAGTLTWAPVTGPGGGAAAGGADTQIQYNDAFDFNGNASFTFNESTLTVTLAKLLATDTITAQASTNSFTGGTNSTSTSTGTIVVTGGVGVSQDVTVGGNVINSTTPTETGHLTNKNYVDNKVTALAVAFGL